MAPDPPRPDDPDDWWSASSSWPHDTARREPENDDDWLRGQRGERGADRGLRLGERDRRVLAAFAAVALVVLVLIGLAAAGVFTGGSPKSPPTAVTETTGQTTTTAATTPKPPAHVTLPLPTGPLKPGDTGTQVKRLQRALASLGYSSGKVDGDYGPATVGAVQRFQKAKKLTADGVLGPKTLAALRTALRAG